MTSAAIAPSLIGLIFFFGVKPTIKASRLSFSAVVLDIDVRDRAGAGLVSTALGRSPGCRFSTGTVDADGSLSVGLRCWSSVSNRGWLEGEACSLPAGGEAVCDGEMWLGSK